MRTILKIMTFSIKSNQPKWYDTFAGVLLWITLFNICMTFYISLH
jgi:hypothetical protein